MHRTLAGRGRAAQTQAQVQVHSMIQAECMHAGWQAGCRLQGVTYPPNACAFCRMTPERSWSVLSIQSETKELPSI